MRRKQAQAIVLYWPGANCPALNEILDCNTKEISSINDSCDCVLSQAMLRVGPVNSAEEDVCICQDPHLLPLIFIGVDAISAHRMV